MKNYKNYKVVYFENDNKCTVFYHAVSLTELRHKIINTLDMSLIEHPSTKVYEVK